MSVPNQKKIFIQRVSEKAAKDYLKVSNNSLEVAMYNLKGNAFKLWIYFADNKNGYAMDLYPVDFCTKAKVSDSTYRRAFEELENKGYLIKRVAARGKNKGSYFYGCQNFPKCRAIYTLTDELCPACGSEMVKSQDILVCTNPFCTTHKQAK